MDVDVMENAMGKRKQHKIWLILKVLGNEPEWKKCFIQGHREYCIFLNTPHAFLKCIPKIGVRGLFTHKHW
jgi:hypothetical protein